MLYSSSLVPPSLNSMQDTHVKCKVDSGATNSYIRTEDKEILSNIKPETENRTVIMPNNHREKM